MNIDAFWQIHNHEITYPLDKSVKYSEISLNLTDLPSTQFIINFC